MTAKSSRDLNRHPEERDQLRDLKLHREKVEKNLTKLRNELPFRKGIAEQTINEKIRDKLLLKVPERYRFAGSGINHLQLNSDMITFKSYCGKHRIKNPLSVFEFTRDFAPKRQSQLDYESSHFIDIGL